MGEGAAGDEMMGSLALPLSLRLVAGDPDLLQGACPTNFAALGGLGDGLARAGAGAGAALEAAAAAAVAGAGAGAALTGSRDGGGGVGHGGLSDSLAREVSQRKLDQTGDRVEGTGVMLTVETRVFAVVVAAAWAVAAAVLRVFYPPPSGTDKCPGKPIVRRNRTKPVGQPAKRIACVSSQLGRPVTHARFEGKNALEEDTQACGDRESSL
ncbi:hypothetical protein B0H65DRAFT_506049 [Neurospora tetraspora]|uniref:Uncharacterized protein n=1 Tax=Neurospora tetraspora TaxID=94610 RepID=A0AAE0JIX8_9PEZI|nr:hypothetical protein B0H65DRAFT_506049 [Neurospora tetraspora]